MSDFLQYENAGEIDLAQYDTAGKLFLLLTQRNLTEIENIFQPISQWPRPVQIMNRTGGQTSCWNVPLHKIRKSHMTLRRMIQGWEFAHTNDGSYLPKD